MSVNNKLYIPDWVMQMEAYGPGTGFFNRGCEIIYVKQISSGKTFGQTVTPQYQPNPDPEDEKRERKREKKRRYRQRKKDERQQSSIEYVIK